MRWLGTYRDAHGEAPLSLESDGHEVRAVVRDVVLTGRGFDDLGPLDLDAAHRAGLTIASSCLCACTLTCAIPIGIATPEGVEEAILHTEVTLGSPQANGALDREEVTVELRHHDRVVRSKRAYGWYDEALASVMAQLPEGHRLRVCLACRLSDYSPYGSSMFGTLHCFRKCKPQFRAARTKQDMWPILEHAELVQETHLCDEFE
jgi:hypothetical protein